MTLGKEAEVREARREGHQASPSLCFLFPLLPFLAVCGNTRHVHGKAGAGREHDLLDLRARRGEYLPALGDEEFSPP